MDKLEPVKEEEDRAEGEGEDMPDGINTTKKLEEEEEEEGGDTTQPPEPEESEKEEITEDSN